MMRVVTAESVTRETPGDWYLAYIVSTEDLTNNTPTGADVEGMADDDRLAAGSVIRTPAGVWDALEDGVFTQRA